MSSGKPEDLGTFMDEGKQLLQEYATTRVSLLRLQLIRLGSKWAGYLMWMIVSAFLMMLVLIFIGLVLGFWFSELTGSNVLGFGLATLVLVLVLILLAVFRKQLFINPLIRGLIQKSEADIESEQTN